MKTLTYIFFLSLLTFSCAPETEKEQEDLKKEIMAIHDELMPRMENIHNLKQELEENKGYLTRDSLEADSTQMPTTNVDSLINALEDADESMMSWMRGYNNFDNDNLSHEEQMAWLKKEREKIEEVRLKVISSIMEAQNVLEAESEVINDDLVE